MVEAVVRQLREADADVLRVFRCHQQNRWTKDVQRTIRVDVVDLVTGALSDEVTAIPLGWFAGDELVGVGVFTAALDFEVLCLAVAVGFQGQGLGRTIKQHMMAAARSRGFAQVYSRVHRGNTAMLAINYRLGAWVEPDEDRNYHICVVNVDAPLTVGSL